MRKLLVLAVVMVGCNDTSMDMSACKHMCAPRLVKQFAPIKDTCYAGPTSVACVCEDRLPALEK